MKRLLITGGTGFIGSHIVEYLLDKTDWEIIVMYNTNRKHIIESLPNYDSNRVIFFNNNLREPLYRYEYELMGDVDYVLHLAAKTNVNESIEKPEYYIENNIMCTVRLFEFLKKYMNPKKIINYGTDEVYGPAPEDYNFTEEDRWRPSSPYSASKCGQMAVGMAYARTYGMPIIHSYTMNVFGERQSNDKLIPLCIKSILDDKPMTIHSKIVDGKVKEIGSRHWLYAKSAASATLFLLENAKINEHYNIRGDIELNNKSVCDTIGFFMGKDPKYEYVDFHKTRPGHDRRYSLDGTKIKEMGWESPYDFDTSLEQTVNWYIDNKEFLYD